MYFSARIGQVRPAPRCFSTQIILVSKSINKNQPRNRQNYKTQTGLNQQQSRLLKRASMASLASLGQLF